MTLCLSSKKERVCGPCVVEQSHLESASEGEDSDVPVDSRDDVMESVEVPAMRSPRWKQKEALYLNADDADLPDPPDGKAE